MFFNQSQIQASGSGVLECSSRELHLIITQISEDDQFIYCGTTTGDIMKINMKTRLLASCGPVKAKYSLVGELGRVIID